MKKTSKQILLLCCVVMAVFAFCGCGTDLSDSPYLGTWTAVTAEYGGITFDATSVMNGDFTFTLKADGTFDAVFGNDSGTGGWSETETGVLLTGLEDDPVEATVDGDTMTLSSQEMTFTLQR